eukprot:6110461-Prymnesium_polylepis.2
MLGERAAIPYLRARGRGVSEGFGHAVKVPPRGTNAVPHREDTCQARCVLGCTRVLLARCAREADSGHGGEVVREDEDDEGALERARPEDDQAEEEGREGGEHRLLDEFGEVVLP